MTVFTPARWKISTVINWILSGCSYSCIYSSAASVTPKCPQDSHLDLQYSGAMNKSRKEVKVLFLFFIPFHWEVWEMDFDSESHSDWRSGFFLLSSPY